MRFAVLLLVVGVLGAVLGVAVAHASGTEPPTTTTDTSTTTTTAGTTTESTSTTSTTTTPTTTSTTTATTATGPAPAYSPLRGSTLPDGCVGAGVAAVAQPSRPIVTLDAPATNLGPSGYPASNSIIALSSAQVLGSECEHRTLMLSSVSLFGGAVTAQRVEATGGKGQVVGLTVAGVAVPAKAGATVAVEGWGLLTRGATFGRLTAPLMLRLLKRHDSLPAGTRIAIAFAASAEPSAKPRGARAKKRARHVKPPNFPAAPSPFTAHRRLTDGLENNPVIAIASRYLGIRYQWGGSKPSTGFDCSGLVQYVFAQLGVPFVHYAAAQWDSPYTVWVPPQRLAPGDLVFFVGSDGTRKAPGHVGIYLRDGYFIDAPHTGAVVRVDSLTNPVFARQYIGARRVVGPLHEPDGGTAASLTGAFGTGIAPQILAGSLAGGFAGVTGRPTARSVPAYDDIAAAGLAIGGLLLVLGGTAAFVGRRRHKFADSDRRLP